MTVITNTWRSWRGWGLTGGLVPWDYAHGYEAPPPTQMIEQPRFEPGTLGTSPPEMAASASDWWNPEAGWKIRPAAVALTAVNNDFLAYVGGGPGKFTTKDHNYRPGEKFEKQAILVNDQSREPVEYEVKWSATLAGSPITDGEKKGTIASGETLKIPLPVELPATGGFRSQGEIKMKARLADREFEASFSFAVFGKAGGEVAKISVFDPKGETSKLLQQSGVEAQPWKGEAVPLLVVGRDALSSGEAAPAPLEAYVRKGGRLVVFNQNVLWLERDAGFRTSPYVTRRMFPTQDDNPITKSLEVADLWDWRGAGSAYPERIGVDLSVVDARNRWQYGFHWGNQGSVASAALEKPHLAGWRPVLEAEFDLMYATLMELRLGAGLVVFSSLDFENRGDSDPVADLLLRRILDYAAKAPTGSKATPGVFIAGDYDATDLSKELKFANVAKNAADADLVIAAPGASDAELLPFTERGTPIMVLPHRSDSAPFGVSLKKVEAFRGDLKVPTWAETTGVTESDLRRRVDSEAWVIANGAETAGGGLLGRKEIGKSTVIYVQVDPELYPIKQAPYYRYSRWRGYRTLANIIGNLGGELSADANLLAAPTQTLPLSSKWRAALTAPQPEALVRQLQAKDTGLSPAAKSSVQPDFDDSSWKEVEVGRDWKSYGNDWAESDGEAVFRLVVDVPESMAGQDLQVSLGDIDDLDVTFWNGKEIGKTGGWFASPHIYRIPADQVKAGQNVLAVRVFNRFGEGGLAGGDAERFLRVAPAELAPAYHSDFNPTSWDGDVPYRYSRW